MNRSICLKCEHSREFHDPVLDNVVHEYCDIMGQDWNFPDTCPHGKFNEEEANGI